MKIELWADIICPWCGLGNHRLDQALERFARRDDVEVIHRSFFLDPALPGPPGVSVRQMLRQKYGLSDAQVESATGRVESLARRDGLEPYRVLDNQVVNTALAHELLAYATSVGKNDEAWRRMFGSYFGEARSIGELESLLAIAQELGLDPDEARQALERHAFRGKVEEDVRRAHQLGIRGVPFFLIDGRYAISGAQETEVLLGALNELTAGG